MHGNNVAKLHATQNGSLPNRPSNLGCYLLSTFDFVYSLTQMGGQMSVPQTDLSGRVAVVTGGNAGIGYETSKALAKMGAHTIIACRTESRATEVTSPVKRTRLAIRASVFSRSKHPP